MRIVVWNCNMALGPKLPVLAALRPDVAVVTECAEAHAGGDLFASQPSRCWVGDSRHKGLAVLGFGDYTVAADPAGHCPDSKYFLPVRVRGPVCFNLLAVWAFHYRLPGGGRARKEAGGESPMQRALSHYREFLVSGPSVVAGDFNDNVRWDRPNKPAKHAETVARLAGMGLASAYHHSRSVEQGAEPEPTLYWRDRAKDRFTYHIDYCFIPDEWTPLLRGVTVGVYEDWISYSDHVPLAVDVAVPLAPPS